MADGSVSEVRGSTEASGMAHTPCLAALSDALARGDAAGARSIVRRCARAAVPAEALEQVLIAAERTLSARLRAAEASATAADLEAIRVAATSLETALAGAEGVSPEASGPRILVVGLPADPQEGGRALWRWLMVRQGYGVDDLGVKAPAVIAGHAAASRSKAVAVYVAGQRARRGVQGLVGQLQHRGLQLPVLVGGPGVDAALAQWVAVPEGGEPYWGGVYYCEDGAELLEVLRQIVLYTPPPSTHTHTHAAHAVTPDAETCASCGGCPLVGACDAAVDEAN